MKRGIKVRFPYYHDGILNNFQICCLGEFQSLKTDVEFKLNTILNTIESPDSAISDDDKMTTTSKESSKVRYEKRFSFSSKLNYTYKFFLIFSRLVPYVVL